MHITLPFFSGLLCQNTALLSGFKKKNLKQIPTLFVCKTKITKKYTFIYRAMLQITHAAQALCTGQHTLLGSPKTNHLNNLKYINLCMFLLSLNKHCPLL